jgi:HEAT repeat protein
MVPLLLSVWAMAALDPPAQLVPTVEPKPAPPYEPRFFGATVADWTREVRDGGPFGLGAVEVLARFGAGARPAVPVLIPLLAREDPKLRALVATTLGRIGPGAAEAVPALRGCLTAGEADVRVAAARALGSIGPPARPAAPHLRKLLADESPDVRIAAAAASLRVNGSGSGPVRVLLGALAATDEARRATAAQGLIEAPADAVVGPLTRCLAHEDATVRREVVHTLARIGPAAATALPALVRVLGDPDADVRAQAAYAFVYFGDRAAAAVRPLTVVMLSDPSEDVRYQAASALGHFERYAVLTAVPLARARLLDPSWVVRHGAGLSLDRTAEYLKSKLAISAPEAGR